MTRDNRPRKPRRTARDRQPHISAKEKRSPRAAPDNGEQPSGLPRGMRVGPTSEQTRRRVAEARVRQGLSPRIDNPAVIESLALFLRHTFDTLDHEPGQPDESDR
ncbi:hypothetical protein [Nocardia altamirensis]|uniref:hypothetical protein n=1 Tax=Nocardia altamirensis TaxID=472158 RepID=UPI000840806B|nr:hypothetical protein [Nocardia altamirensis]